MKDRQRRGSLAIFFLIALVAVARGAGTETVPVVPAGTGGSVRELIYVRPFTLEHPYVYTWTKEQPLIDRGLILVVAADPELVRPRAVFGPVLYVGPRPAEVACRSVEDGTMVLVVPGETDLLTEPAFFGSGEFPERVDASRGRAELAAALRIGARPWSAEQVTRALQAGGDTLRVRNIDEVYHDLADVILAYAPAERETAESFRRIPVGVSGAPAGSGR